MTDSDPISKARQVKKLHESEWMELEEVVAVGVGIMDNKPCIVISVKDASPSIKEKIPYEIDGTPIRIDETGEISAN